MYRLNELVEIDKSFGSAVNLQLDINRQDKVEHYIPTGSTEKILEHYMENVEKEREKATILIGPYGKGKSHLLLVLLHRLRSRERPFLPVLVSGSEKDVSKAFFMGITEALNREGLRDLTPESAYGKALEMIQLWQKNYPGAYDNFIKCIREIGYEKDEFLQKLEKQNDKVMHIFRDIYPQITSGSHFTPMVETQILRLYEEIGKKLYEEHQYGGMFVVFDEFSKYVEGHEKETFSHDMKIIQDMCELAAAKKHFQIHITFVAHKSVKEYGRGMDKEKADAYAGVAGRLKELRFTVSSLHNYQLVEHTIGKNMGVFQNFYEEVENTLLLEHGKNSYELLCFSTLFLQEDFNRVLVRGCFPLMPLTTCLLLWVSEKAAQNERSIFTYLANDEKGSLYRHVMQAGEAKEKWMVTADAVYDYFAYIFREDTSQTRFHREYLKAEYVLSKTDSLEESQLIKVLALLEMVNRPHELPAEEKTLAFALNKSEKECLGVIHNLEEKGLIRWNTKRRAFVFVHQAGVDLEGEIKEIQIKLPVNLSVGTELKRVYERDYILPKLHNQEFTITRFFEHLFLTTEEFLALPNGNLLFEEQASDGKIVAIISGDRQQESSIREKIEELEDERIIVLLPKKQYSWEKYVRRLLAIEKLAEDEEFAQTNPVVIPEILNSLEEVMYELNQRLWQVYQPFGEYCMILYGREIPHNMATFNGFLSKICNEYYGKSPKINNELINRQHISAQNRKARKNIVEKLLKGLDCSPYSKGTSPEATIYRAVLIRTGIRGEIPIQQGCLNVLEEIKRFMKECGGKKGSFDELYQRLSGKGYGLRRGILPIYLANELPKLSDTPVIYFQEKEVPLEAEILENINENPKDYFLYIEEKTIKKEEYLESLEHLFLKEESAAATRMEKIAEGIWWWYRSLPQIAVHFKKKPKDFTENEYIELVRVRKLLNRMELNPRELLLDKFPEIFQTEDYHAVIKGIERIKHILDDYLNNMKQELLKCIRNVFCIENEENMTAALTHWYKSHTKGNSGMVLNQRAGKLAGYLSKIDTYHEEEIAGDFAKLLLDIHVEDFKDSSLSEFQVVLRKTTEEIEESTKSLADLKGKKYLRFVLNNGEEMETYYDSIKEDTMSLFMQNAMEEVLEEFGDSLEVNQKVSVLVQVLEQLLCR